MDFQLIKVLFLKYFPSTEMMFLSCFQVLFFHDFMGSGNVTFSPSFSSSALHIPTAYAR